MKRQASLHITEEALAKILSKVLGGKNNKAYAKAILEESKSMSIPHRSLLVTNDKLDKKVEKLKMNSRSSAYLFSETLSMLRKKAHHKGITAIKPGESEWLMIKEVSNLAKDFCREFGFKEDKGFIKYIEIGLSKLRAGYSLNKFKYLHPKICSNYEAVLELQQDDEPQYTEALYKTYLTQINERIGATFEDYKEPETYLCFKKAKDLALRLKIKTDVFVLSQFHALEWKSAVPDPHQLYGTKAIERVRNYCYEKNIKVREEKKINFKDIKTPRR